MKKFGRRSTAEQVSEGIDLRGKNALVTGANTGLGMETARVLALRGATVTMACRDLQKAEIARKKILTESEGGISGEQLDILKLDLNKLENVRASADEFLSWKRPLHILVNNAGIMIPMERRTDDGLEAHMGINHLAHFMFTHLLLGSLKAARGARVVVVSSGAMGMASLSADLQDLNWEQRKFSGMKSYGDSKLMNYMFAREVTRRYAADGIVANAVHPGVIATELARDQSIFFMALGIFALPFMKGVGQGAATSMYAATAPAYQQQGGLYFSDCKASKPSNKLAMDDSVCSELWERSVTMAGL